MKKRKHSKETKEKISKGVKKARLKKKREQEDQAFANELLNSFKGGSEKRASKYFNPKSGREWQNSEDFQEDSINKQQEDQFNRKHPSIDRTMESAVKRRNNSQTPSDKIWEKKDNGPTNI